MHAPVALIALAVSAWLAWPFVHDDGFITLRYAARWLDGRGLTWTRGPAVEGYTHPLWLLQLVVLGGLGVALPLAARTLGVAWLAALVPLWLRRAHLGPLLVLVTMPAVARWAVSGLETVSFAVLAVAAAAALDRLADHAGDRLAAVGLGAAVGCATLTRPEGAGLAVVAGLWLLWRRDLRALLPTVAVGSVLVGALLAFRLTTYGTLVSTSSAAKLGDFPLTFQVQSFALYVFRSLPVLSFAAIPVALAGLYGDRRGLARPALLTLPLLAGMVAAGGDHMPHARFFVPCVALWLYGAGVALQAQVPADRRRLIDGTLLGVAALQLVVAGVVDPARPDFAAAFGRPVGRFLETHLPAGALVATATAGSTPYYAPSIDFLDTLGLNDPHIAQREIDTIRTKWQTYPGHRKGDGAYVLAQEPDVIVLGGAGGFLGHVRTEWFLTDRELLESPDFRQRYRPYGFRVDLVDGEALPAGVDADQGWTLQTGLSARKRPGDLLGDPDRSLTFIAWLRIGDIEVDHLRTLGRPLDDLLEAAEQDPPPPFCDQLWGAWAWVPCDDGSEG